MSPDLYKLARFLVPGPDRLLGRVAGELATVGVPVFPCVPGQKRPLTARGFHDASTDLGQVERWWARWPEANLGLPTGAVSGVVVVDVDIREHVDGRESMRRALDADRVGMPVFTVVSPSGGRHGYYPATLGVVQRSWQTSAGVDFRGDGGYIVMPPSHTAAGAYRLATVRQGAAAGIDSDALRDFLDPRRPVLQPSTAPRDMAPDGSSMDVSRLAGWVAGLGEGERNQGLFWAACRAAEHDIEPATAVDVLGAAAAEAGLGAAGDRCHRAVGLPHHPPHNLHCIQDCWTGGSFSGAGASGCGLGAGVRARRWAVWTAVAGTVFIAVGAFWLSFTSLADLAARSGIRAGQAWAWPLIVDGIIVVATVAVVALADQKAAWYPWALLIGGATVSVTANALHAIVAADADVPAVLAAAIAAVPPVVLLAITHLTVILTRTTSPEQQTAIWQTVTRQHDEPTPEPATRIESGRSLAALPRAGRSGTVAADAEPSTSPEPEPAVTVPAAGKPENETSAPPTPDDHAAPDGLASEVAGVGRRERAAGLRGEG